MWENTPVPLCCFPGLHTESWDTTVRAGPSPSSIPEDATACGRQPGEAVPVQAGQVGRAVLFACVAVLGCPEQVRSTRPGIALGQNSYRNTSSPFVSCVSTSAPNLPTGPLAQENSESFVFCFHCTASSFASSLLYLPPKSLCLLGISKAALDTTGCSKIVSCPANKDEPQQ